MFTAFERLLAIRYLKARREEGFLSVFTVFSLISIVLGVGTLVVVMSVMDGFRTELLSRIIDVNGHLNVRAPAGIIQNYQQVDEKVRAVDGVDISIPFLEDKALLTLGDKSQVALLRGVSAESLKLKSSISRNIQSGDLANFGAGKVVLGSRLAQKLGADVGDQVTLIAIQNTDGDQDTSVQNFELAATFDIGLYDADSGMGFMDLSDAQTYFTKPDTITAIEVVAADGANVDLVATGIYVALDRQFTIQDWRTAASSFLALVKTQRNVMFLVLSLIILVAAMNIISGQIMLVNGKTRDIAILRTMGATRKNILKAFFLVGGIIGAVGTFVGVVLGWLFAANIDFIRLQLEKLTGFSLFDPEVRDLTELPSNVELTTLVFVVCMALFLTLAASLYPAWKAARMSPIEGIRNA